jgi:adenylosuccinate synthase
MKEKLTFNDIRPLIDGDPVAIFKDGWGEEDIVYEDTLTYDDEKYQNFIKEYGDVPIRCISTSVNTTDCEWINIAILI